MNEPEAEYVDILRGIKETTSEGKEFVVQQAPLAAAEYVAYCRYTYTSGLVLSVLMLLIFAGLFVSGMIQRKRHYGKEDKESVGVGRMAVGTVLFLFAFVFVCHFGDCTLKAWFSPRVLIMEKAVNMASGDCK